MSSPLDRVSKRWLGVRGRARRNPEKALQVAVQLLDDEFPVKAPGKSGEDSVPGYPFDSALLGLSPLYRRSRKQFLKLGGGFRPALVSSPRSLGSVSLLDDVIEYTPLESELRWGATDPLQLREKSYLSKVKFYGGSLFHEQNHRILWDVLPPSPVASSKSGKSDSLQIRHYLNFAESLVIALDFALGDELFPLSEAFWQFHACYDPGTSILRGASKPSKREYRNYLHAVVVATYCTLEMYDPARIPEGVASIFPGQEDLARFAAERAVELDEKFVVTTNRIWQKRHAEGARKALSAPSRNKGTRRQAPLVISEDPFDQREQYLIAEKWFELFGL